jgi:hypothetical protein
MGNAALCGCQRRNEREWRSAIPPSAWFLLPSTTLLPSSGWILFAAWFFVRFAGGFRAGQIHDDPVAWLM